MTVTVTRLANGMTIATDPMPGLETVSLGLWVGVGTRHEPAADNGVAHLLEHMVFKGTERRSARAIAEEIENVGGHLNAYTGRETTAYHAKVLAEDLPLATDLIADIVANAVFDEGELARERAVVLQEIGQAEDTPDDIVFDRFQETAYPGQALGRPVLGRPEIVSRLGREALLGYRDGRYGAERMVFAAAGKVEHAEVAALAEAAFGAWARGGAETKEPSRYQGGDLREARELEQVHLVLGFEAFGFHDPDYHAATVLSTLLGGGMSSRLFQEVREKRGLAYAIFSFLSAQQDSGLFGIYAGTGEEEAAELLPVVAGELTRLVTDPVPELEVKRAKAQIKASILMGRERSDNRAEHLANQILVHGRPLPPEELVAKVEAVEETALMRVAERCLASAPTLAALGPIAAVESWDRLAARLGAGPRSDRRPDRNRAAGPHRAATAS